MGSWKMRNNSPTLNLCKYFCWQLDYCNVDVNIACVRNKLPGLATLQLLYWTLKTLLRVFVPDSDHTRSWALSTHTEPNNGYISALPLNWTCLNSNLTPAMLALLSGPLHWKLDNHNHAPLRPPHHMLRANNTPPHPTKPKLLEQTKNCFIYKKFRLDE